MIDLGILDEAEFQDIAGNEAVLHAKLHSLLFTWHYSFVGSGETHPPLIPGNVEDAVIPHWSLSHNHTGNRPLHMYFPGLNY